MRPSIGSRVPAHAQSARANLNSAGNQRCRERTALFRTAEQGKSPRRHRALSRERECQSHKRPTRIQILASPCRPCRESLWQQRIRVLVEIAAASGPVDRSCDRQKQPPAEREGTCRSRPGLVSNVAGSGGHCAWWNEDRRNVFLLLSRRARTISPPPSNRAESRPLRQARPAPSTNLRLDLQLLSNIERGPFAPTFARV